MASFILSLSHSRESAFQHHCSHFLPCLKNLCALFLHFIFLEWIAFHPLHVRAFHAMTRSFSPCLSVCFISFSCLMLVSMPLKCVCLRILTLCCFEFHLNICAYIIEYLYKYTSDFFFLSASPLSRSPSNWLA